MFQLVIFLKNIYTFIKDISHARKVLVPMGIKENAWEKWRRKHMKYNVPDKVVEDIAHMARKNGVKKVILFGSRAKGSHTDRSDIDLAASGGNVPDFYNDLEEEAQTLLMFDVVNLNRKISPELQAEISKDGVVLYEEV